MESVNLSKGQNIDLTKTNPGLKIAALGLGWDAPKTGPHKFDLDAFALLMTAGKLADAKDVVYFGNKDRTGVLHSGDNLTGVGDGDDETITVDFALVPATVEEVLLCVNIFEATQRNNQNFGQVENAFIRIYDKETNTELAKYDLSEDYSAFNGMVMGKLYRKDGEWKFKAIGEGKNGDINQIAAACQTATA